MSNQKIRELLSQLQAELDAAPIDDETRALINALDRDIQQHVPEDAAQPVEETSALLERAKALETRFAVKHPAAELFLREIAHLLGKLGILLILTSFLCRRRRSQLTAASTVGCAMTFLTNRCLPGKLVSTRPTNSVNTPWPGSINMASPASMRITPIQFFTLRLSNASRLMFLRMRLGPCSLIK